MLTKSCYTLLSLSRSPRRPHLRILVSELKADVLMRPS